MKEKWKMKKYTFQFTKEIELLSNQIELPMDVSGTES